MNTLKDYFILINILEIKIKDRINWGKKEKNLRTKTHNTRNTGYASSQYRSYLQEAYSRELKQSDVLQL